VLELKLRLAAAVVKVANPERVEGWGKFFGGGSNLPYWQNNQLQAYNLTSQNQGKLSVSYKP